MIYALLVLLFHLMLPSVWGQGLPVPGPGNATGPGVTTFTDDFQRSNESPLSKSGAWTQPAGTTVFAVNLVSNKAVGATANENMAVVATPTFPADHRAKVTFVDGNTYTRVWVRLTDSGGYMLTTNGGPSLAIYKVANSGSNLSYSQIGANINISGTPTAGDTLEIEVISTTLNAYFNDALVRTATDSTYATGQPGIGSFSAVNIASSFSATSAPH